MFTSTTPKAQMTDIHMHLIPGVDDGAETMEMALLMILRAREQGITRIVATPHSDAFRYSSADPCTAFQRLVSSAAKMCPGVTLYLGCEVYCEAGIMDSVVDALKSGRYPTMNGTEYVLTEFSQWVVPEKALPCVEALVHAGYKPIIAHMERYTHLRGDMALVKRFRDLDARIQINAYSLFDETDGSIKEWARCLVREHKADFLGTDAHRTYHRPPSAACGLNWLYENCDRDYVDRISRKNAEQLLFCAES